MQSLVEIATFGVEARHPIHMKAFTRRLWQSTSQVGTSGLAAAVRQVSMRSVARG